MKEETFRMLFYALNGREPGSSKTTPADFDIKQNKIPEYHEESSQKQLVQLIEQSVEEELRRHKNVRLSLSAGYDASAILGACVSKGIRVRCFSYGSKNSPRNSDVEIARKMAQSTGMSHEIWPMDGYPAEEIQKSNSNWFEGVANRCGELGAWIYYQESLQPKEVDPPLFTFGDECFGWNKSLLRGREDVLLSIGIQPICEALRKYVDQGVWAEFQKTYLDEMDRIYSRADHLEDLHDKKDFLYFHERVQKAILPWRENFAGRFGRTTSPLLSAPILDFVGKLPRSQRLGKRLMRKAVTRAYPEIFRFPRAKQSGAPTMAIISKWPEKSPLSDIVTAAERLSLNKTFFDSIGHALLANERGQKKQNSIALLKGIIKRSDLYAKGREFFPPIFSCHQELVLSRLQIWLLWKLQKKQCATDGEQSLLPS
jgi:hypothetical protein